MALKKTPPPEPVNTEEADALESGVPHQEVPGQRAAGPSVGELEERAVEAEDRAAAAEARSAQLSEEMALLQRQVAALMRDRARPADKPRARGELEPGEIPVFAEDEPFGLVVGDPAVGYVQDGHQFGRDKQYIATEPHRGSPRAFNPKLVGWVKPGRNKLVDTLDGFRDQD